MEIQGTLCSIEGKSKVMEKKKGKKRKRLIVTSTSVLNVTLRRSGSQAQLGIETFTKIRYCNATNVLVNFKLILSYKNTSVRCTVKA